MKKFIHAQILILLLCPVLAMANTAFTASAIKRGVLLQWAPATGENNGIFKVERSTNGADFSVIGEVKSVGASQQSQVYTYTDETAVNGTYYYRLKQVNTSGQIALSAVRPVTIETISIPTSAVYPNPAISFLNIDMTVLPAGAYTATVLGLTGNIIKREKISTSEYATGINVQDLAAGAYVLVIEGSATKKVNRFLKN